MPQEFPDLKDPDVTRPKKATSRQRSKAKSDLNQLAPGMPALDNVEEVVDFVSPQGVKHTILKTTERDGYDPVPKGHRKRKLR